METALNQYRYGWVLPARWLLRRAVWLLAAALLLASCGSTALSQTSHVNIITIKDTINPGTQAFIDSAIQKSTADHAEFLLILLDTPGGLMTSMRGIAQSILNSPVPVVVFVYPSGARAASAGVFVTAAADIAAMAPGTNIGAAHPVTASGGDVPKTMNEKVVNDMLAFARSIAQQRGRNAQWLQDAIRKSVSITAEEAYQKNVIDLMADDPSDLLAKLDGWQFQRKGKAVTFHTSGIQQHVIEQSWSDRLTGAVSNPNIAYVLLMIGIAGLFFELSQPGAILPGVVGGVALVLALYALQSLPVNYAGILLIVLAIVFFILEVKVTSYGMLSLAGVVSLALGSLMLFRGTSPEGGLAMSVFIPTVIAISAFFVVLASLAFRAQMKKSRTGYDALQGLVGEVKKDLTPQGKVFVNGELWNAEADENLPAGTRVRVVSVENLKLKVRKIDAR